MADTCEAMSTMRINAKLNGEDAAQNAKINGEDAAQERKDDPVILKERKDDPVNLKERKVHSLAYVGYMTVPHHSHCSHFDMGHSHSVHGYFWNGYF